MKMTCENCCSIFSMTSHCPTCGSSRIRRIVIVNQKNNRITKRKIS